MHNDLERLFINNVEKNYNIKISGLSAVRGMIVIESDNEKYVAKKVNISQERWVFVDRLKEHLALHGYPYTDRYLPPVSESGLFKVGEDYWTLCYYTAGRESDFDNPREMDSVSAGLALMHKCTRGFFEGDSVRAHEDMLKVPAVYAKRLEELKRLRKKAARSNSEFDMRYVHTCSYFIECGERAIELINGRAYTETIQRAMQRQEVCHSDITYQNILVDKNDILLVNFESAVQNTKNYDIANLIRRKMRKCNWDPSAAEQMIKVYHSVNDLVYDDITVLKAMLLFPQKYWRIANRHYNMNRSWAERGMVAKLEEAVSEQPAHAAFIKEFR